MGVFEMGFGDEDGDPDHRRFLNVDEDEKHFKKLQKVNQRGKKMIKKNKKRKTNKQKTSAHRGNHNNINGALHNISGKKIHMSKENRTCMPFSVFLKKIKITTPAIPTSPTIMLMILLPRESRRDRM